MLTKNVICAGFAIFLVSSTAVALKCQLKENLTGAKGTLEVQIGPKGLLGSYNEASMVLNIEKPTELSVNFSKSEFPIPTPIYMDENKSSVFGYRFRYIPLPDLTGNNPQKVEEFALTILMPPSEEKKSGFGSVYLRTLGGNNAFIFHGLISCSE